jgi:hypothetical protein
VNIGTPGRAAKEKWASIGAAVVAAPVGIRVIDRHGAVDGILFGIAIVTLVKAAVAVDWARLRFAHAFDQVRIFALVVGCAGFVVATLALGQGLDGSLSLASLTLAGLSIASAWLLRLSASR